MSSRYSPHGRVYSESGIKSLTKQSDALNSDVNSIVARHIAHRIPLPQATSARYGDFSGIRDYHEALNRVNAMNDSFSKLPANVRKHCHNDPGEFLDLVYDTSRREELELLGLVPKNVVPDLEVETAPRVSDTQE